MSEQGWASAPAPNWDDVSAEPLPTPPPGVYGFKVAEAEPHMTKPKAGADHGSPAVKIELTLTHAYGEDPGSMSYPSFGILMLSGSATFRTKQLMNCLGCGGPESNERDDVEAWCEMITGREGYAQFRQRDYTPRGSAEIKKALDVERFLTEETLQQAVQTTTAAPAEAAAPPRKSRKRG